MHPSSPIAILTLVIALGSGGCAGAPRSSDGSGGQSSAGGANGALSEHLVTWDQNGNIDRRFGIAGFWYSYSDCDPIPDRPLELECTRLDPEVGPDAKLGWSTSAKRVCMKGTVPRVTVGTDKKRAYQFQWGAGIGFGLNWSPLLNDFVPYDATVHGIVGFMFDVTEGTSGAPAAPPTLRIGLGAASVNDDAGHFLTIALPSRNQPVLFADVDQGTWVMVPTPFTPQAILSVSFDVYTNEQAPKAYDFCVSNFRVLM